MRGRNDTSVTSRTPDDDKGRHIVALVECGAMSLGEAQSIVDGLGPGNGRIAVRLSTRCEAPVGWALKVVLSDPSHSQSDVDDLKRSVGGGGSSRTSAPAMSKTRQRKLRRMLY